MKTAIHFLTAAARALLRARIFRFAPTLALVLLAQLAAAPAHAGDRPMARISTTLGDIELELYPESAPATVQNFIDYINSGHFDELIFHRVIPGFVIQGGGFTADMQQRDTRAPIQNEADNGLKNERGTLSMARTNDPHSATSQFFINLADNAFLDHTAKNPSGWGYAVFARVTSGMEVVDKIAAVPTTTVGPFADVPSNPVVITEAKILPRG